MDADDELFGVASDATVSDDEINASFDLQQISETQIENNLSEKNKHPNCSTNEADESDATISDSSCTHTDNELDETGGNGSNTEGEVEQPISLEEEKERWESHALLMKGLWKTDHSQWLERSKKDWRELRRKRRHDSRHSNNFNFISLFANEVSNPDRTNNLRPQKTGLKHTRSTYAHIQADSGFAAKVELVREQAKQKLIQQAKVKVMLKGGGLKVLLREGLVESGDDKLYIQYLNQTFRASLSENGCIVYSGQSFSSPSAWSIFVKRLANPSKKADDGWKSVKYTPTGQTLEAIKDRLHEVYIMHNFKCGS